jgi:ResB-like family
MTTLANPTLDRLAGVLTSARLTLICLAAAAVLVFAGTLAQADGASYQARMRYFRSFIVWWSPGESGPSLPVLPGAYTVGGVLLLNLIAVRVKRFGTSLKEPGMPLIGAGLILLVIGQFFADRLSERSVIRLARGVPASYTEDLFRQELVIADKSGPVVTVPASLLARKGEVQDSRSELTIRVKEFWPNADVSARSTPGAVRAAVAHGTSRQVAFVRPQPVVDDVEAATAPAAVIEVLTPSSSLGTWIVSPRLRGAQRFTHQDRELEIALGAQRHYRPFSITLQDARRDLYEGTDVARSIWSRVRIQDPATREDREAVIAVNRPFRYRGETYYQSQMDAAGQASALHLVRNPARPLPYLCGALMALGLLLQLATRIPRFARKGTA